MDLDIVLECGCSPNFKFKNNNKFNQQLKTKKHLEWERSKLEKNYIRNSTEYENTILSYQIKLKNLTDENEKLKKINENKTNYIYFYLKNFTIIQIILMYLYSN